MTSRATSPPPEPDGSLSGPHGVTSPIAWPRSSSSRLPRGGQTHDNMTFSSALPRLVNPKLRSHEAHPSVQPSIRPTRVPGHPQCTRPPGAMRGAAGASSRGGTSRETVVRRARGALGTQGARKSPQGVSVEVGPDGKRLLQGEGGGPAPRTEAAAGQRPGGTRAGGPPGGQRAVRRNGAGEDDGDRTWRARCGRESRALAPCTGRRQGVGDGRPLRGKP